MEWPMGWYLRSLSDRDTHRGELRPDGMVTAVCGAVFRPVQYLSSGPALRGEPADPQQVCLKCRQVTQGYLRRT
jgi:hypothetical protein